MVIKSMVFTRVFLGVLDIGPFFTAFDFMNSLFSHPFLFDFYMILNKNRFDFEFYFF